MSTLRSLVVWLVLATYTSITICALGATPMFPDCSNINSNFTNSSGGDFEAIGCSYPSRETNISLGLGAGTTTTAYIAYGKVAAGASASLWIQCPATALAMSISIMVTGIAFGQDASFRFTGALPAHSSLHISNNTFYLTQRNRYNLVDPSNSGIYYTTAILIGAWGTALVLEEGTAMSAINNTVTYRWAVGGNDQVVAVAVIGASATLKSMSTLSMSGNSIIDSSISSIAIVAFLYLYSSISIRLTLYNQSAIDMSGNSIINSSTSGNAHVAFLYLYSSSSSLTLYNQSAIAMIGNSIINGSLSNAAYVAYLYLYSRSSSFTLYNQSAIAMNGNSIINSSSSGAYVAFLHLHSLSSSISLTLCNQSAIAIRGNNIINSSASGDAFVAYLYQYSSSSISSLTQSAIAMSGNIIKNSSTSGYAYVAFLYLKSPIGSGISLTLFNLSAIDMSGNSIINSSFSSNACVAHLYLSSSSGMSLSLHNKSTIAIRGNSIVRSSSRGYAYVAFLYLYSPSGSISLTLYKQSEINMSGNSIINGSSSGYAFVAFLNLYSASGSLTLYNLCAINMRGNSIVNSSASGNAYVAYLYLLGSSSRSLTLYNLSAIDMSGNNIINGSISGNTYVAYLYLYSSRSSLTLYNYSAIAMSGNSIINSSVSGNTYVAYLYLDSSSSSSSLTQSAIAMSGNSIINSRSGSNVFIAYLNLYSSSSSSSRLTLYNQSAIAMSGNSHAQVRVSLVVIEVFGPILLTGMASITMERNNAYLSSGLLAVLRISAEYISLNDSSSISTTGNRLQGPAQGQGARLASLLTISSSRGNGTRSVLAISEGSSLVVALNDIIAGAIALNVTMKVSVEFPSTIAIVNNHIIEGYASWLASLSGGFHLDGTVRATGNRVDAEYPIANFSFVTITSTFTNGAMASVQACDNYLSWVGHIISPKLYLQPTPLASLAAKCATESRSRNGSSVTLLRSVSNTSEATKSMATEQQCPSSTIEPTNSLANCSIGVICQLVKVASDQLALFDTCTEPGPTETAAKDSAFVPLAKYIGDAAKQAAIQSSYNRSGLPSGNSFYYGSVVVLWPEGMANVTHVAAASPSLAACWVHARSANATEIRVAIEALTVAADSALDSASAPVALMALSLSVSCGAAAVVFNRTIAMERPVVYLPKSFVPIKAVQDTATTSGALSVTVGAVAVPIAAMQQGVALALLRMAQCEEDALNGEPLDVSVHPLQFGLGAGSLKYGRGALVGNLLVVPAIWCALMYLLVPLTIRALTDRTLDASRDFVGWPGMALMPLAVLSEGSAMASIGLLTQGSVGDIIMGLVGLAILLVATAGWAAELWRMRRQVVLIRAAGAVSWAKAIHPRFEWQVGKKKHKGNAVAITSYLDKRIQLVGSSWWLWSALAAHVLSMVVGVAEGLPVGSGMCRVRWAVASLAAVLQAAAVMTNTVPIELLLLGAIGAMSCILVVLIAFSTFDVVSPGSTFSALNAVGMVNSILGIALLGIGACTGAYEIFTQRSRRALSARRYSQLPATPLSLLSVPMLPQQQASPPPVTSPPTIEELEELSIEVPRRGRSSRYPDMPAQWASILDDADLAATERKLASGR